jgi:glucose-6-phosphate 1-dehydrogenase
MSEAQSPIDVSAHAEPPPCAIVIFGAAGDLTRRLLMPALYNLRRAGLLPQRFALIGFARRDDNHETFRRNLRAALDQFVPGGVDAATGDWLAERTHFLRGDLDDPEAFDRLAQLLAETERTQGTRGNCLFYLATPASAFATIVRQLGDAGLVQESAGRWRRVIIEKPFGTDLHRARALNREVLSVLAESQTYRIDHYLGKETVQNIMVFRFANGLFEPMWNRDHIDHVQITVAETVGVEQRGKFYDATGALRDMVPNHLFQLLTLTAMEPAAGFDPDDLRSEKAKVLNAVHNLGGRDGRASIVRAQYGAGVIAGREVTAYRQAPSVAPDSTTETYVALKVMIDNWRWAGVPFYLRTGKALARRRTEIAIQFKQAPLAFFRDTPVERLTPNDLILHIQPEEGVTFGFGAKIPGPAVRVAGVEMKFNYRDYFKVAPSTGYETLIYDCMMGDATLFQRADNIEAGWRVAQQVLDVWAEEGAAALPTYPAGSEGPSEAGALLRRDGRRWRTIGDGKPGYPN